MMTNPIACETLLNANAHHLVKSIQKCHSHDDEIYMECEVIMEVSVY